MKVIRKIVKTSCYCCDKIGGTPTPRSKCKVCNGSGKYKETDYYHIVTDKNGNQYCFDGDSIK